jgi:hypothetical protein
MKYTRSTELALDGYELVAWYDVVCASPLITLPRARSASTNSSSVHPRLYRLSSAPALVALAISDLSPAPSNTLLPLTHLSSSRKSIKRNYRTNIQRRNLSRNPTGKDGRFESERRCLWGQLGQSVVLTYPVHPANLPSILTSISCHLPFVVSSFVATLSLGQNDYRRKWDKEEYLAKSKAQDAAAQEYAQAAQAAQAAGKKPPPRPRAGDANLGPKPTKALEAREEDLGIEKNLGKSMLVAAGGKGPGAGFYVSDSISSGESQVASWERVKE